MINPPIESRRGEFLSNFLKSLPTFLLRNTRACNSLKDENMGKLLILLTIYAVFVAATLSLPSLDGDSEAKEVEEGHQAMKSEEDGQQELVIMGENMGRADLSKIRNLFNFSAYLEGRDQNLTQLTFVPLITMILSGIQG